MGEVAMNWMIPGSFLALLAFAVVGAPQLWAQQDGATLAVPPPEDTLASLEARVNQLDEQIRILNRLREISADSAAAAAKDKQSATANSKDGFTLKSADGKYTLR